MFQILDFISGICWTVAYITAIILGFRNRTWCFPSLAICQNFAWESMVVVSRFMNDSAEGLPFIIQFTWLVLDVGILITWMYYDRGSKQKIIKNTIQLFSVLFLMYIFAWQCALWEVMAFVINMIMSVAFIYRKAKYDGPWASHKIAVSKLFGTLAATLGTGVLLQSLLITWLGGMCLLLDLYYVSMFLKKDSL